MDHFEKIRGRRSFCSGIRLGVTGKYAWAGFTWRVSKSVLSLMWFDYCVFYATDLQFAHAGPKGKKENDD